MKARLVKVQGGWVLENDQDHRKVVIDATNGTTAILIAMVLGGFMTGRGSYNETPIEAMHKMALQRLDALVGDEFVLDIQAEWFSERLNWNLGINWNAPVPPPESPPVLWRYLVPLLAAALSGLGIMIVLGWILFKAFGKATP